MEAWEIEDYLQEEGVFQNALDGRKAHADAYNTIIDYKLLEEAINKIMPKYTTEQWGKLAEYWKGNAYLSPNQAQLSSFIKRKLKEEKEK
jgi:hypothetical protein